MLPSSRAGPTPLYPPPSPPQEKEEEAERWAPFPASVSGPLGGGGGEAKGAPRSGVGGARMRARGGCGLRGGAEGERAGLGAAGGSGGASFSKTCGSRVGAWRKDRESEAR